MDDDAALRELGARAPHELEEVFLVGVNALVLQKAEEVELRVVLLPVRDEVLPLRALEELARGESVVDALQLLHDDAPGAHVEVADFGGALVAVGEAYGLAAAVQEAVRIARPDLVDDGRLRRTQTSTVQIRTMLANKPPIRIVSPGRCFRRDTPDATHGVHFHQIEGLYIDKDVSLADLKSTLEAFAVEFFGDSVAIRMRPHFFPFTEPSVECDFTCVMCGGKGCKVCKNSGWIECVGAGMVNPNVLRNVGYDPETCQGFAFGMGIERLTMIKHRIEDLRLFSENDVRFLEQF